MYITRNQMGEVEVGRFTTGRVEPPASLHADQYEGETNRSTNTNPYFQQDALRTVNVHEADVVRATADRAVRMQLRHDLTFAGYRQPQSGDTVVRMAERRAAAPFAGMPEPMAVGRNHDEKGPPAWLADGTRFLEPGAVRMWQWAREPSMEAGIF